MLERILKIHPGPLRLLLVCSVIVAIASCIIALRIIPLETKIVSYEIISGQTVEKIKEIKGPSVVERTLLIVAFTISCFVVYWLIIRIVVWINDGFSQQRS